MLIFTRHDKLDSVFAGFILFAMIIDSLVWTLPRKKNYGSYITDCKIEKIDIEHAKEWCELKLSG